jgi:hypothetical protein
MLRKVVVAAVVALVCALPAAAEEGKPAEDAKKPHAKELRIFGSVVRASEQVLAVENEEGDEMLTCIVPERLAAKAAALKAGEKIKMICIRPKGKRAQLVAFHRFVERPAKPEKPKIEKPAGEEVRIYGRIAALSSGAVTVQSDAGSLTCRAPVGIAEKLARFAVGDAVKMMCRGAELTYLEKTA